MSHPGRVIFSGVHCCHDVPEGGLRVRAASEEDCLIGRAAGLWAADPPDPRFGPRQLTVRITLDNPLCFALPGGWTGDPSVHAQQLLAQLGHVVSDDGQNSFGDIAQDLREAGYDGLLIDFSDGRRWALALDDHQIG